MYSVAVSHTLIIGPTYILTHVERGQGKKQHLLYLFEILTLPNMTLPVGFHSCWPGQVCLGKSLQANGKVLFQLI